MSRPGGAAPGTAPRAPGVEVEVATWRPVEVVDVDGWHAGLSAGFTRRGNSVVALVEPPDPDAALARVEALYAARGLPPVVRVCPGTRPVDLDARLAARGYAVAATTLVMAANLDAAAATTVASGRRPAAGPDAAWRLRAEDAPDDGWLRGWLEVKTAAPIDLGLAGRLVGAAPARYLRLEDAAGTVGVVRAAVAQGWVAISCLTVQPRARRRGVGALLTRAALRAGADAGATAAFLQVEQANAGAVALYAGLGFEVVDRYHYRERRTA